MGTYIETNMVREIVTLQAGQCGNQTGLAFWKHVATEHGLTAEGAYEGDNDTQLERVSVFFKETSGGKYTPQAINFDLEPGVIDVIKNGSHGKLFNPQGFVHGQSGAGNNWAKGHCHGWHHMLPALPGPAELGPAQAGCQPDPIPAPALLHHWHVAPDL